MHSSDYENAVHSYTGKASVNVVLLAHKKFTTMGEHVEDSTKMM